MLQRWLLTPPYLAWHDYSALTPAAPALGSIVFEVWDDERELLAGRLRVSILPPWLPRIVAASPKAIHAVHHSLVPAEKLMAAEVSLLEVESAPPPAHQIVALIRERPAPPVPMLVRWLAARLDAPWILPRATDLLRLVWGTPASKPGSTRARRHASLRWLNCSYRDLRTLAQLAQVRRPQPRVKDLPDLTGMSLDRLRDQVTRLLGVQLNEYNALLGWEWVFETAIRRGLLSAGTPDERIRPSLRYLPTQRTGW